MYLYGDTQCFPWRKPRSIALIKEGKTRIEEHLRRLVSTVSSNFKGKSGNIFLQFSKETRKIAIRKSELRSISNLEQELCRLNVQHQDLEEKNESLQKRCDELYQSLLLAEKENNKLNKVYLENEKLKTENAYLCEYIDKIAER
jgi:hypothetical protein